MWCSPQATSATRGTPSTARAVGRSKCPRRAAGRSSARALWGHPFAPHRPSAVPGPCPQPLSATRCSDATWAWRRRPFRRPFRRRPAWPEATTACRPAARGAAAAGRRLEKRAVFDTFRPFSGRFRGDSSRSETSRAAQLPRNALPQRFRGVDGLLLTVSEPKTAKRLRFER